MRHAFQRDANHSRIVSIFEAHGGTWFDTADHRKLGVDGGLFRRAGLRLPNWSEVKHFCWVEIKDGSKPPSARKLKPSEEAFRNKCLLAGVPWVCIETDEEALALVRVTQ